MNYITSTQFRGNGCESAGTIGHKEKPKPCPTCGSVGFRGNYATYEEKQKPKIARNIVFTLLVAAGAIGGLGYLHKTEALSKITNKTAKEWLEKLKVNTATEKCYGWCSTAKTKGVEYLDKIKNLFKKN